MTNIFENTRASWVRYSDYEWRTAENGKDYLLPTKDAQPKPYDPMEDADNLVLAAADIGLMLFHKNPEKAIKAAMQAFACKYGLLGIMTAMPTTAKFIEYEKVYFHKNQIIKTETMDTEDYISLFLDTGWGDELQLTATVLPANATNKSVKWESSNPAVATVSADGLVTGVAGGGWCTITCTAMDGSGVSATCTVSVETYNYE